MYKGYLSKEYGEAFGAIRGSSGALYVKRPIAGTDYFDVTNTYPLCIYDCKSSIKNHRYPFSWGGWTLPESDEIVGIPELEGAISILRVTDPMEPNYWSYTSHSNGFDVVKPFKEHYYIDLRRELNYPENHKRNIKKSNKVNGYEVIIPLSSNLAQLATDFHMLYTNLIERHSIIGQANFTLDQIVQMLKVPGTIVFRARSKVHYGLEGMLLVYLDGDGTSRYHLAAYSASGYQNQAGFGLMDFAIRNLHNLGLDTFVLGAGSGIVTNSGGLTRYKSGFSNTNPKTNMILFKILNKDVYNELSKGKSGDFLPLYRS